MAQRANPTAPIFHMITRRNSDGVKPVARRNAAEKELGSVNPTASATLVTLGTRQQRLCPFDAAGKAMCVFLRQRVRA